MYRDPPKPTLLPYTTLCRSLFLTAEAQGDEIRARIQTAEPLDQAASKLQKGIRVFLNDMAPIEPVAKRLDGRGDRKSTRLNSSHANISYAVFCLKKKTYNIK